MDKRERRALKREAERKINSLFQIYSDPTAGTSNNDAIASNNVQNREIVYVNNEPDMFITMSDQNEERYEEISSNESSDESDDENNMYSIHFDDDIETGASDSNSTFFDSNVCLQSRQRLATWSVETNQTRESTNSLLQILREEYDSSLPSDRRTLCETPRQSNISKMDNGLYLHIGLAKSLEHFLNVNKNYNISENIEIDVNIDGVPLTKSSSNCLWPILINVVGFNYVLMVGTFFGAEKPSNVNNYLKKFVKEFVDLNSTGLIFNSKIYTLSIRAIIADAPARAFLLNIHTFSGYNSCHKCHVKGKYVLHRVTFPHSNFIPRSNDEFRHKQFLNHHLDNTPLVIEQLPIDCVKNVGVDPMHAIFEGVVKQLIMQWVLIRTKTYSLSKYNIESLSKHILTIGPQLPHEFSRAPRPISLLKRFKATEFRQLILYTLPIITLNVIEQDVYSHLLKLHCAIRILSSKDLCFSHNEFASQLISSFINEFSLVYESHQHSFNLHSLLHLCDDVKFFKAPLDDYSCFKFENFLQFLKKIVRSGMHPLKQINNRYVEKIICNTS